MSYAPMSHLESLLGSFRIRGNRLPVEFEYEANDASDSWLPIVNYPHRVWVSSFPINESGWRYANVKKTVAYIVVDEDDWGQPVIEKWNITAHRTF